MSRASYRIQSRILVGFPFSQIEIFRIEIFCKHKKRHQNIEVILPHLQNEHSVVISNHDGTYTRLGNWDSLGPFKVRPSVEVSDGQACRPALTAKVSLSSESPTVCLCLWLQILVVCLQQQLAQKSPRTCYHDTLTWLTNKHTHLAFLKEKKSTLQQFFIINDKFFHLNTIFPVMIV